MHVSDLSPFWVGGWGGEGLTVLLHNLQELHDHLGAGPDEHLPLSALLRVGDGLQSVREHTHAHHLTKNRQKRRGKNDDLLRVEPQYS